MRIEFIGSDSVTFTSPSDPSVNGSGNFSFTEDRLSATIRNLGLEIKMVFQYTLVGEVLRVITEVIEVDGHAIHANPDPISLMRCQ